MFKDLEAFHADNSARESSVEWDSGRSLEPSALAAHVACLLHPDNR